MKLYLAFLASFFLHYVSLSQSVGKLEIQHLTGDFYIYTTYNSYKGIPFPANGMYMVTDEGVALFDTPWDTTQFQPLLDSIKSRHHLEVVLCIATHSHEDRTAGLEFYQEKGIKTYTTRKTDSISNTRSEKRAEFLIDEDTSFNIGQHAFQTYFAGAGHTPDNIVIWFPNEKILYGGCLIKSTEAKDLGNLADANVEEWGNTLNRIEYKFGKPKFIVPGHQSWKSNKSLKHTAKLVRKQIRINQKNLLEEMQQFN